MLSLTKKQLTVIQLLNDPSVHTIYLIGSVGTGKTDIASHAIISLAYSFKDSYLTVFRKNISTSKKTVIPSYLSMLDKMNLIEKKDYVFNRNEHEITFPHNGSKIVFVEADRSKDRQGQKIKGINATANHVDEADELEQVMFNHARSRRGRKNNYGQPSVSIITMNPNSTYLKQNIYDKWKDNALPDGVKVVEFTLDDSWQSQQDIDDMMSNPKPWRERFLFNNWNFEDDSDSLFKYRYFDACKTSDIDLNQVRYVGYDVARSGRDRSVLSLWYGKTLVDIVIIKDKDEQKPTNDQAFELIKFISENAVFPENTVVDAVGIGVGVIDNAKDKGMFFKEFVSGARPTSDKYDMLRSQVIYEFSRGLETGEIKIYEGCSLINELISEAMMHNSKTSDKKFSVESKDDIKKRTGGKSPDIFDAVVMGIYPSLSINNENSSDRIYF